MYTRGRRHRVDRRDKIRSDSTATLVVDEEPDFNYGTMRVTRSNPKVDDEHSIQDQDRKPPPFRSLLIRRVIIPLINYGFVCFLDQSHQVLMPLMFSTSISLGGLDFEPITIGTIMGAWGVLNAIFQVVAFARVIKWLGPRTAYIICISCFLLSFAGFPIMSLLAKRAGRVDSAVWFVLVIQMSFYSVAFMSYGAWDAFYLIFFNSLLPQIECAHLFILDGAPHRSALGSVNGLGQVMGSTVRTLAPTFASSLFAISLQDQIAGGYMVYAVLLGVTLTGVFMTFQLPPQFQLQHKH